MDEIARRARPPRTGCPMRLTAGHAGRDVSRAIAGGGPLSGIVVQAVHGYYRYPVRSLCSRVVWRDDLSSFCSICRCWHSLSRPWRPTSTWDISFSSLFYCVNIFVWRPLERGDIPGAIRDAPNVIYSDFFGDAPYRTAWNWFTLYWLLFCGLLAIATVMFWPRGKQDRWQTAAAKRGLAVSGPGASAGLGGFCCSAFVGYGGWIWYNTEILNRALGPKDVAARARPIMRRLISRSTSCRSRACAA